jgi:hypothetical protein
MFDLTIGVPHGAYRFDRDEVLAAIRLVWPATTFAPAVGLVAESSTGQIQVKVPDEPVAVAFVEVLVDGDVVTLELAGTGVADALVAALTTVPAFPNDGSVVLYQWEPAEISLRASMTADDVASAHR